MDQKNFKKLQSDLNIIDPKKLEEAKYKAEQDHKKELNDLREVMASPVGRRVIWRILEKCQPFASNYVPGDQGYGTTYHAGREDIGKELIRDLDCAKPGCIYQMALDYKADQKRNSDED